MNSQSLSILQAYIELNLSLDKADDIYVFTASYRSIEAYNNK